MADDGASVGRRAASFYQSISGGKHCSNIYPDHGLLILLSRAPGDSRVAEVGAYLRHGHDG